MTQTPISVCVYCGSRPGKDPAYVDAATKMGRVIAGAGYRLVYGAGDVGLMGAVADAAIAANGETFGVIPQHLMELEVGKQGLTHLVITETMHERKKVMVLNSDAFVILPGGFGTMDEFFELITWRQLGLHSKPCYILNIGGYWDHLVALMDSQIANGLVDEDQRGFYRVCTSVDDVAAAMKSDLG